ncbi:MAG: hypothetical protein HRJ53_06755 [Acidobacteria bacterium Pan2503]|uniref:Uncharacterized protein n=1 Tax=Candidatus Acidiferrum panamense TaxID=2741543 RepID=A0A7V8SWA1_9BACT|nr:hypothetical protein [Candidatus Acidoferrum panamensis]
MAPSLNRLMRLHWAARRKLLRKWEWAIHCETFRREKPVAILTADKLTVRITRRSRHMLDHDNLYGSAKIILDAMKHIGLIADDSPEHIELHCEQESGAAMTIIRINPLPTNHRLTG